MPVIDHPVHDTTRVNTTTWRYGCHNKKRTGQDYVVQCGWTEDGRADLIYCRDVFSRECRYDFSLTDTACDGCHNRGTGEAYAHYVKEGAAK